MKGETIPKMQTIVKHFICYEIFWQFSLLHSDLRTYYVHVFEFVRYFEREINVKAKSLAEDLHLVIREVELISNKENLIKWEFTVYNLQFTVYNLYPSLATVSVTMSQTFRCYGNQDR